jgi:hypothetical protein
MLTGFWCKIWWQFHPSLPARQVLCILLREIDQSEENDVFNHGSLNKIQQEFQL